MRVLPLANLIALVVLVDAVEVELAGVPIAAPVPIPTKPKAPRLRIVAKARVFRPIPAELLLDFIDILGPHLMKQLFEKVYRAASFSASRILDKTRGLEHMPKP